MARFKSQVLTQASGSVGGMTYTRCRGGMVIRARAMPVNKNSPLQQAVRSWLTVLATAWNVLTDAQRAAWETYAMAVQLQNSLGDPENVSGRNHFIRSNLPRLQAGLTVVSAGPTSLSLPALSPIAGAITATTSIWAITFSNSDAWATAVGGALLCFTSPPQPPTVNSYKGPYRYAGKIAGAVSPPTSPGSITIAMPGAAGERVFYRCEAVTTDGRMSGTFRGSAILA
jgi:hypothetical protein